MTIEYEAGRTQRLDYQKEFLDRLLRPEGSLSLPAWEELPNDFELPGNCVEIIRQLADETIQNNCEVGVVGYLSGHGFQSQKVRFGKPVLGTKDFVPLNTEKRKFPFSLFLPSGIPVIEIHTHLAARLKEELPSGLKIYENPHWQNPSGSDLVALSQIPSGGDLTRFLSLTKLLLSLVVLPINDGETGRTDIDILVKCRETDFLARMEDLQRVCSNFDVAFNRFIAEKGYQEYGRHLVDWKTFFGTVVRTYKVGYYSSYNCSSAAHQELSSEQPFRLMRVPSFDSLDALFASPSFLSTQLK